jgi:uncharacterized damage-inducible protein DinB
MTVSDLTAFYEYSSWANHKLFTAIEQLTPEQFVQPVAGSYGSVRNTLVHMLSAEWGWLERCGGHPRGPKLTAEDFPTTASVTGKWTAVEGYAREFLSSLTDADLGRIVEFAFPGSPPRSLPLGNLMHHALVHGVHHRGQVSLLLRELGVAPGNVDVLIYDIEQATSSL